MSAGVDAEISKRPFLLGPPNGSEVDLDLQLRIARQNSIDAATAIKRGMPKAIEPAGMSELAAVIALCCV
jgi:hypothetical protein